ncbi:Oidioi.mRNA.OKI2018_I69.chr2.g4145.t1.cds [Oikopleura dioica]|uniref:Oidioi.mRNA.OKI2018_I69.chr2.g4145.t1.cds n=1 Tax=Oikopleura dioica TaxID=34765 RepID=A0ABN7SY03_OIKDI|nr:Oidioi.mRNA.OKI2018_I69.chr2.g4145.t1.cds [Oikopleura dioica]
MFENGRIYKKPSQEELLRAHGRLSEFVNGTITVIPADKEEIDSSKLEFLLDWTTPTILLVTFIITLFLTIRGRYYIIRHKTAPNIKPYHTVYIIKFFPKVEKMTIFDRLIKIFKNKQPFAVEFAMEGVYLKAEKIKFEAKEGEPYEIVLDKSLRRVKKIWITGFNGTIVLETKISKVLLVYPKTTDEYYQRYKDPFAKMPYMKALRFFMSFIKKIE